MAKCDNWICCKYLTFCGINALNLKRRYLFTPLIFLSLTSVILLILSCLAISTNQNIVRAFNWSRVEGKNKEKNLDVTFYNGLNSASIEICFGNNTC
jgi:hypothetical protein